MKIEIRYEEFNDEYVADILFRGESNKYIASNNLKDLLAEIYCIAIERIR